MTTRHDDALSSSPSEATPPNPEAGKPGHANGSIFSFAALAVAGFSLILAWYALSKSNQLNQQSAQLKSTLSSLNQQQQNQVKTLDALRQQLQTTQSKVQDRLSELNDHLHTAMTQRLYQKQDWVLLKARYYLELAQINAHWTDNQQTTAALLHQADDLLKTLPDQRLYTIRQAISKELAEVNAAPAIDIAGLMSQLDAAQSMVSTLPIKQSISSPSQDDTAPAPKSTPSAWRTRLRESLNLLEKLVVVRHQNDDIKPILSPLHQALLRESIRMNLQEAQWALLQNNVKVYQQSLAQVLKDINRTFEKKAPATRSLVTELQALKQTTLNPSRPLIDQSLPLLNQLIDSKNDPAPTNQPASPSKDS